VISSRNDSIYRLPIIVPPDVVDDNRHVNNLAYLAWMQEAAIQHSAAVGCTRITSELSATWVVRTHRIEYFMPAFSGEHLTVLTWVANFRKVRSLRRYKIIRDEGEARLAEGETDWVFVDAKTGRPRAIPEQMRTLFTIVQDRP
jgi:acyl-CoA thioester hydrolase